MKSIDKNKEACFFLADNYGWQEIEFNESSGMVSYYKDAIRLDVYLTKMTVCICINKKQIFLKRVSMLEFEKICINPEQKISR